LSQLDGASIQSSATAGLLDGNATANRSIISAVLPASVPPGSYLMVKWEDPDHPLDDDGFGLDDFAANWSTCTPTSGTDIQTVCDSLTWIDGITYTEPNNIATYALVNAAGCDSIVTLDLTVNYSLNGFELIEACAFPYTDANTGITYNAPDTIVNVSTTPEGCPSTFTTYVNLVPNSWMALINSDPDLPIIFTQDTFILGYQWFDCNTGQIFPSENNDTLVISQNGNYGLIANYPYNCVDTSNCINVFSFGAVIEEQENSIFNIKPNPSNGNFTVDLENYTTSVALEITSLNGQKVFSKEVEGKSYTISVPELSAGTYILTVSDHNTIHKQRIVIQ